MTLKPGQPGQLDVQVDGEILEFRRKGFWERFFTGKFPTEEEVVDTLRQRLA